MHDLGNHAALVIQVFEKDYICDADMHILHVKLLQPLYWIHNCTGEEVRDKTGFIAASHRLYSGFSHH